MKKAVTSLLVCILALFMSLQVMAQPTLHYQGGDTDFLLSGSTGTERGGQIVTIKVTDTATVPNVLFMRQIQTDASGSYQFNFSWDNGFGDGVVTVSENNVLKTPVTIYKSTEAEVTAALNLLNGATSITEIIADATADPADADALSAMKTLQINPVEFKEKNQKSGLLSAFLDGHQYTTINDFMADYMVAMLLANCEAATSSDELLEIMKEAERAKHTWYEANHQPYVDYTKLKAGDTFRAYTDVEKTTVLASVFGKCFTSFGAFYDAIYSSVVIREYNKYYNYSERYNVVANYNDFLNLPLDTYDDLTKYEDFKEEVFSVAYSDIDTLKSTCDSVYTSYANGLRDDEDDDDDDDRGGHSTNITVNFGGGGGSGSSSKDEPKEDMPVKPAVTFTDLQNYQWAEEAILALASKGVIAGKSANAFAPGDSITRAEFVKILVGALAIPESSGEQYSDVPASHWAAPYVYAAVEAGIVNGISPSEFCPDKTITRQEMAAMCMRALAYKQVTLDSKKPIQFKDQAEIAGFAQEAVEKLSSAGIINGRGDGAFAPLANMTRAEGAKIVYSLLGRV